MLRVWVEPRVLVEFDFVLLEHVVSLRFGRSPSFPFWEWDDSFCEGARVHSMCSSVPATVVTFADSGCGASSVWMLVSVCIVEEMNRRGEAIRRWERFWGCLLVGFLVGVFFGGHGDCFLLFCLIVRFYLLEV